MKELIEAVTDKVTQMQEAGQLDLPKDYSAANALRGAWLMLQDMQVNGRPVLEVCTKESVSFALLKMVLDGLTPLKNHHILEPTQWGVMFMLIHLCNQIE